MSETDEVRELHGQIHMMSNTIEALKRRVVDLEFQLIDKMAAEIAHAGIHEMEQMLSDEATSQLPDRDDN